ncbi:MAG: hypothetical protein ACTTGZ_06740 [Treponema sp.]
MNMVLSKKEERRLDSLLFNIGRRYGNTYTGDDDISKIAYQLFGKFHEKKELFFILRAKLYSRFHKYNDNEAEFFHKELNVFLP